MDAAISRMIGACRNQEPDVGTRQSHGNRPEMPAALESDQVGSGYRADESGRGAARDRVHRNPAGETDGPSILPHPVVVAGRKENRVAVLPFDSPGPTRSTGILRRIEANRLVAADRFARHIASAFEDCATGSSGAGARSSGGIGRDAGGRVPATDL